jgi:CDP-diacylglycerol pyrophosphatase
MCPRAPSRRRAGVAWLVAGSLLLAACATGGSARDALWHITSSCLDPSAPRYCDRCRSPRTGMCPVDGPCETSTDVWAMTVQMVAIRDIKMCGCPAGFVHGLAMPRSRVRGVEDATRPRTIWRFAWDAARERIPDVSEIALVANPPDLRTQDHLHVHLVRLQPDARARIAARSPARVARLEDVWDAADRRAAETGVRRYGVLVAREPSGEFLVLPEATTLERDYTVASCR